jgi:tyrosyl-tRNA synthetase
LDVEERIELISRPPIEEVITPQELRTLLETKNEPMVYDGFEGSGIPHLGTGLLRVLKLKDLIDAQCKFTFLLADWHSVINEKFGGDLQKIQTACKVFIEVWKALMKSLEVDQSRVEFKFATDIYDQEYWMRVSRIAKDITLSRAKRALTITGRIQSDSQSMGAFLYVPMQVSDIFQLKVDLCQLGMDQRRANILARELGPKLGEWKPVCAHNHLLMGLKGPQAMGFEDDKKLDVEVSSKMSKSKPETSIYMTESQADIEKKIRGAFCPERDINDNPLIEICQYLLLRTPRDTLEIERAAKYGGPITITGAAELKQLFSEGKIHPLDLKEAVAGRLDQVIDPVRKHFESNREAKKLLLQIEG